MEDDFYFDDEHYSEIVERETRAEIDDIFAACERDTGHHYGCAYFDPDDGECDCGLAGKP